MSKRNHRQHQPANVLATDAAINGARGEQTAPDASPTELIAAATPVTFAEMRARTAKRNIRKATAHIEITNENMAFHYLEPKASSIFDLKEAFEGEGVKTADGERYEKGMEKAAFQEVFSFLCGVICDEAGNMIYKDPQEFDVSLDAHNMGQAMWLAVLKDFGEGKKKQVEQRLPRTTG